MYRISYVDDTNSNGTFDTEQFTFETSDEGITIVKDLIFGCSTSHKIHGDHGRPVGRFGLASQTPTIYISNKFGFRFSYCIGNISNLEYSHNKLILGDDIVLEGDSTPLNFNKGLIYYVTLKGISVDDKMLDIDRNTFKNDSDESQVTIDSSTTETWLVTKAYQILQEEIEHHLEGFSVTKSRTVQKWQLCYYGSSRISSGFHNLNVIGLQAQQFHNAAFDVVGDKLYFLRIDCDLLEN
ncbi:LOW QUALITY PROTEIN: aspartyl protease UND-like [Pistacia vera]|uniref:LOW QUALITY PROTEIN: aspartyl protease UND-like n=1 Tax=Pistacia vera TaxID=55513 RepID=UPI0012639513|nr:LOW QUALITY PROTEIN: aspartyl protease UND-like [Pistacia vera]